MKNYILWIADRRFSPVSWRVEDLFDDKDVALNRAFDIRQGNKDLVTRVTVTKVVDENNP